MEERESEDLISASLLANTDFNRKVLEQFRLGMSGWTDSDSEKRTMTTLNHQKGTRN